MQGSKMRQADFKNQGFTLIELLIVIGILSLLATIVIVAINPARQFAQARNAQRFSDVNTILNAIHQFAVDNNGILPTTITTGATEICRTGSTNCTSLIDLSVLTVNEKYIISMPKDPSCATACDPNGVGYTVVKSVNDRITVASPDAELSVIVSVSR